MRSYLAALQQESGGCTAHKSYFVTAIPTAAENCQERSCSMFKSISRRFQVWRRYSVAMNELSHLSDRELADIGISRTDIQRLAWMEAHRSQ
jgi:uncharacterized protein YjiS (DUF1127 family)